MAKGVAASDRRQTDNSGFDESDSCLMFDMFQCEANRLPVILRTLLHALTIIFGLLRVYLKRDDRANQKEMIVDFS